MKTFAIPVLAAALALGACDSGADDTAADDTAVEGDTATMQSDTTVMPAPTATETTVVTDDVDANGDRISIDENGVNADVGDGDTRVRADVDRDPSLTVERD